MLTVIKGAGDIATGCAMRLWRCGIDVVMTELELPSSIRRTVCFSEAMRLGETTVEGVHAVRAASAEEALTLLRRGILPVLCDPEGKLFPALHPDAVVDAILAKRNTGTRLTDAPAVVGVGPGFTVGVDCHAVVETMRGHTLGRVLWSGSAIPNTGVPGLIAGYSSERVLHSECGGIFHALHAIGDTVSAGETVFTVDGTAHTCEIGGVLRGILPEGFIVPKKGFKCGDVDPRCEQFHCHTVSDKALSVGGGALEAVLMLTGAVGAARRPDDAAVRYLAENM